MMYLKLQFNVLQLKMQICNTLLTCPQYLWLFIICKIFLYPWKGIRSSEIKNTVLLPIITLSWIFWEYLVQFSVWFFFQTYPHKRLYNKDCTVRPGRHSHNSTGTRTTLRQVRAHTTRWRPDLPDVSQQNCVRNAVYQKER